MKFHKFKYSNAKSSLTQSLNSAQPSCIFHEISDDGDHFLWFTPDYTQWYKIENSISTYIYRRKKYVCEINFQNTQIPFHMKKIIQNGPKLLEIVQKFWSWKILKNPRRFFYWTKLLKKVSIFISSSMKLAIFRMRISKIDHSALDFTTHSSQSAQHSPLPLSGEKYAFCWVTLCMHGAPQSAHRCAFIIYRPVNIYWPNLISDQMYLCII